jgi:DNA-binding GntR family transcriptional regulator
MRTLVSVSGGRLCSKVLDSSIIEGNKELSKKFKQKLGKKIYSLKRLRLIDDTPIEISLTNIPYDRCPGIEQHDFSKESLYNVLAMYFNIVIDHGNQTINTAYVTEHEGRLLQIEEDMPVFYINGISWDPAGEPVECFKSLVRPDLVKFESVLTR